MPMLGGVYVPDNLAPTISAPAAPRPGFGAVLSAAAQGAFGQLRYGLPYQFEKAYETLSPADEQFYQQGLARTAVAANAAAPASVSDLTSGRVGIGSFVGENLAASLPYMVGSVGGALVGGRLAGPEGALAGAWAGGVPQFSASNVARAVQEHGSLTPEAATRSFLTAIPQAASDVLVERYLPGAGKLFGGFAATQAGGFLRRTATSIAKAGATEAVTEAGQQLGERYAAGIPLTTPDAAAEYVNAAVTAFAVGGVLGAGGGFRRSHAVSMPADQVSNDDITSHINEILRLPAPTDVTVDSAGTSRVNPNTGPQLALPSPDHFARPDGLAAPEGIAVGPDAASQIAQARVSAVDPRAPTGDPGPSITDILTQLESQRPDYGALAASTPPVQLPQASTSVAALTAGQLNPAPRVEVPTAPRLFADQSFDDLRAALSAKDASPGVHEEATREVEARRQEAIGEAPLTTDNYQQRVDELKTGLRGGWVEQLQATDPADLREKVYDRVFVDQDTRSNTAKFAQRVGLLDDKLEPTPAAAAIEAQRTAQTQALASVPPAPPAPPTADPVAAEAFDQSWRKLQREAGVTRLAEATSTAIGTPSNLEDAQTRVVNALADDKVARPGTEVSQVEKLARKMGLLTNDEAMDFTPAGLQAWERGQRDFLRSTAGLEHTTEVAQQQGYTGAQASIFDRGVQAVVSDQPAPTFDTATERVAYEAGKAWADNFVTAPKTPSARRTAAVQQRATGRAVERTPLAPAQVQQQGLNRMLDAADLRTVPDSDVATLRRMVRENASPDEVAAALEQVQGGKTLFKQPDTTPRPEVDARPSRGQPRFRELNVDDSPAKAQQRAETEAAVRAYKLRNEIEGARQSGDITDVRAQKLHDLLDEGKVDQANRVLQIARRAEKGQALSSNEAQGAADATLEQAITGKSFDEVVQHLVDNAPSTYMREVMRQVQSLAEKVRAVGGHKFEIRIAKPGDVVPTTLADPTTRAYAEITRNPSVATVWLKSVEMGPESGLNYQLAAHEMLHAVTMQAIEYAQAVDPEGKTTLGEAVRDMNDLGAAVMAHLKERIDSTPYADLKPFEQSVVDGTETNALEDVHELMAWGLTNPEFQRYLQGIEYKPRQSVFSRLAALLRGILGLDGKYDNALVELLRASEQVLGTSKRELLSAFPRNRPDGFATTTLAASAREGGVGAANRTAAATNDVTQSVSQMASAVVAKINPTDFGVKARRIAMGWLSHNQLDRQFANVAPWLVEHSSAKRQQGAIRGRWENIGDAVYQDYEKLLRENPKAAKAVSQMMETSTVHQLDPNRAFDQHDHLANDPNAPRLRQLHADLVKMKNDLSRGDGAGIKLFETLRQLNEAQNYGRMAADLHAMVALDPELALGVANAAVNPNDEFMTHPELATPADVHSWWRQSLQRQMLAAENFVREKKGIAATGTTNDQIGMAQHLSPIEAQIAGIHEALAGMARAPYFHLGRFGDQYASATIRSDTDGKVDAKAQTHVAEELEKAGFTDVRMSADISKPQLSARFESVQQRNQFRDVLLRLQREGWLSDDPVKAAPRSRENHWGAGAALSENIQRAITSIENSPRYAPSDTATPAEIAALDAQKNEVVRALVDTWLESQPDSSISKVLAKRYTIAGYNPDMMRNFAHRWNVGSTNIANTATRPKFNAAYTNARAQIATAADASNKLDPDVAADLLDEIKRRDAREPLNPTADIFDKSRAFTHAYFLGFSPAYGMINMTQLGVTALPELAKQSGYTKSFHAMRRASGKAFAIMRAAVSEAGQLSPKHWADVTITESVLGKSGLSKTDADFVRHMLATGTIDIGTSARQLGQIAERGGGSNIDTMLKYAGAVGLYTETFSRLVTALAAHELHGGDVIDSAKYATNVVSNSMFDYQNWNTARQLGKQGFLGPVTPLLTQFMSYQVQLTEKLYSEVRDAIGKQRDGESAETAKVRRQAAGRFLMGHLTAVTALAGTLGLPFASAFATAIERLVDSADGDDEPFDATASYRSFLAGVFGKDVAEVVARGLPRAVGFDVSKRAGEADLLPFSQLLGDKRSWQESIDSYLGRSIGAGPSMLLNMASAGEKFGNGDLLGGLKDFLPVAFKGPTEAYRMSTEGYIDSKGNRLPMSPRAGSYLWQMLGFTPSEKAEYSEARSDQQARRGEIALRAETLRTGITRAMAAGDNDRARELVTQAQQFDQDNPAFAVIPSLAGSVQRQAEARSRARALRTPLGVPTNDIAGQRLTRYANVDY